jgi:hypothetical protein
MMDKDATQPPPAPDVRRSIRFYPAHLAGMVLLALVPLLALFGVFGDLQANAEASSSSFRVLVDYPSRSRYWVFETMSVMVTNLSGQARETVTLSISEDYVAAFGEVAFEFDAERVTPDAYEFALTDLQPGETRVFGVEFRSDRYGQHDGLITVTAPDAEPVELRISTFIFP